MSATSLLRTVSLAALAGALFLIAFALTELIAKGVGAPAALSAMLLAGALGVGLCGAVTGLLWLRQAHMRPLRRIARRLETPARDFLRIEQDLDGLLQQVRTGEMIGSGIQNAATMIMISDLDHVIRYMNGSLIDMFRDIRSEVQKDFADFDPNALIGTKMDFFHKVPGPIRDRINSLTGTHEARITLGSQHMLLSVHPVRDRHGKRIGTMVEWRNVTREQHVHEEIARTIRAASSGDLSARVTLTDEDPVLQRMGRNVNELISAMDGALGEIVSVVDAMSNGDLSQRITGQYEGRFGQLRDDMNALGTRIGDLVERIRGSTGGICLTLEQIVSEAGDLSARAEQQAGALEETAATMEEMSATVRSNAGNAAEADRLARESSGAADEAGSVVTETVSAIERIEESSGRIAEIISVIDSIAFQTNLLALNAAVEAARAGEAGRGFAVVAAEVRTLAQRSSESATDIKNLIQTSASHVADGVMLVRQTGTVLDTIRNSIAGLSGKVSEIAGASAEQASGVDEITANVSHLDQITQENSAIASKSVSAAHDAMNRAQDLETLIAFFRQGSSGSQQDRSAA